MESVKITVNFVEKASRLELIIRFVWGFIVMAILGIVGFFVGIALAIQWLHILFLGKRHPALAKFINAWFTAEVQMCAYYVLLATDERPPLIPAL